MACCDNPKIVKVNGKCSDMCQVIYPDGTECSSYQQLTEETYCNVPHKINGQSCPCTTCLIKMVCDLGCEKFSMYARKDRDKKIIKRRMGS